MSIRLLALAGKLAEPYNDAITYRGGTPISDYTSAGVIAFVAGPPSTITDASNGFVTAGFLSGDTIQVEGSSDNDDLYIIETVVAGIITLAAIHGATAETAGAGDVTISTPTRAGIATYNTAVVNGEDHFRLHDMDDVLDHNTPGGTENNLVDFDAAGFPMGDSSLAVGDVSDAVTKKHTRLHDMDSASDHNSPSGTANNLVDFDASGYPVDDSSISVTDAASAVSLKHAIQHAVDSTDDHTSTITENNLMDADSNGLPDDSGIAVGDVVESSAVIVDHTIVRGDGGAKKVQDSGVIIDDDDRIGIGLSPTAALTLPAGTADAGTGPLKFTAGTALTTPETGVMEFHNSRFYITNKSVRKAIDRTSDIVTSTVTAVSTAAETLLWTASMPANSLVAGNVMKFHADGMVTNDGDHVDNDFTIRVRLINITGTILVDLTPSTKAMTDVHWHMDANATQRAVGVAGARAYHVHLAVGDADEETEIGVVNINTEATMDLLVTVQWATAHANNSFSLYQGYMEYKG